MVVPTHPRARRHWGVRLPSAHPVVKNNLRPEGRMAPPPEPAAEPQEPARPAGLHCQAGYCNVVMSRKNCHRHDPAPLSFYRGSNIRHATTSRYPPTLAQTRLVQQKCGNTRLQRLQKGVFAHNTYHRTHVAGITHTYPSKHDNTQHYPHGPHRRGCGPSFCATPNPFVERLRVQGRSTLGDLRAGKRLRSGEAGEGSLSDSESDQMGKVTIHRGTMLFFVAREGNHIQEHNPWAASYIPHPDISWRGAMLMKGTPCL